MNEYQIQTELNDAMKREIALHSEEQRLQEEIQTQERKLYKNLSSIGKVYAVLIIFRAIMSFLLQIPTDLFFFIILAFAFSGEIIWQFYGLRKMRRQLEHWKNSAAESEISV